jgi:hypothetical protein
LPWQACGRTPGDLIVSVPVPTEAEGASLVGSIREVRLESCEPLLLRGRIS